MRFLVDIDDTVAWLIPVWLDRYNRDFHDNLTMENILDWNLSKFVKPECGQFIYSYIEDRGLYDTIQPVEFSLNSISAIRNIPNSEIIWCTSSTTGAAGRKKIWLQDHGFWDNKDHYVETKSKFLIQTDVIIDDNFENVTKSTASVKILMSRPWNLQYQPYSPTIQNWQEFIEKIKVLI